MGATGVSAATPREVVQATLSSLYRSSLQSAKTNESLDARIRTERARLRNTELQDLREMITSIAKDDAVSVSPTDAVKRQRQLVDTMQTIRNEASVDRDLLVDEEASYPVAGVDVPADQLQQHSDVLARHAALNERIAAVDQLLPAQMERLTRLQASERFSVVLQVLNLFALLCIFLAIVFVERGIRNFMLRRIHDSNRRYVVTKLFSAAVYTMMVAWVIVRLSGQFQGFLTSLAIVGAAVAVALQTIIKDIVGWMLIFQKRLYAVGHRVSIGPYTGDVVDITLLWTVIIEVQNTDSPDTARLGKTLSIPNALVLERPVLNFNATSDFIDAELSIITPGDAPIHTVETILLEVLRDEVGAYVESARRQAARRTTHYYVPQEPNDLRVFVDVVPEGIRFSMRFLTPIGKRRTVSTAIIKRVLERLRSHQPPIRVAYNQSYVA
jgi:small-conductance mechanosensitive channel